jgi:hypothetical protein
VPVGELVHSFTWPQVLPLECVKELEDAFTLMEVLREHSLPLLQVRLVAAALS